MGGERGREGNVRNITIISDGSGLEAGPTTVFFGMPGHIINDRDISDIVFPAPLTQPIDI